MLDIDEAAEVLERADAEALNQEQKSAVVKQEETKSFKAAYRQKKWDLRAEAQSRMTPAQRRAANRPVKQREVAEGILQRNVSQYCPPGGHIWRSNQRPQWQGHMPPRRRVHAVWTSTVGEEACVKEVLAKLWQQYLDIESLTVDACPFKAYLFPDQ